MQTRMIGCAFLVLTVASSPSQSQSAAAPGDAPKPIRVFGDARLRYWSEILLGVLDADDNTLIVSSYGGNAQMDLKTGLFVPFVKADRIRKGYDVSADKKRFVGFDVRDNVVVHDVASGELVRQFKFYADFAASNADGSAVLMRSQNKLTLWPVDQKRIASVDTSGYVRPVFTADRKKFAALGKEKGELIVYKTDTLEREATLKLDPDIVHCVTGPSGQSPVAWSPDGKLLAIAQYGAARLSIWDATTGEKSFDLEPMPEKPNFFGKQYAVVRFSADAKTLFDGTSRGSIRRWDIASRKELPSLSGHSRTFNGLLLTEGGTRLISYSADGAVRRWDVATGREVDPSEGYDGVIYSAVSPDGKLAVLLDLGGRLDVWDIETGNLQSRLQAAWPQGNFGEHGEPSFGFLPDGQRVYCLTHTTGVVSVWNAADGKQVQSIPLGAKGELVSCVPFTNDPAFAVTSNFNKIARVEADGKPNWVVDVVEKGIAWKPAVSPDGKTVAVGVSSRVADPKAKLRGRLELVFLDAATGEIRSRHNVETDSQSDTSHFGRPTFSAEGKRLALPYGGYEFSVFDVETKKQLRRVPVVFSAAMSPDGQWILSAGSGKVTCIAVDDGAKLFQIPIGNKVSSSAIVVPGGRRLLTSGMGGVAELWELPKVPLKK